MVWWNLGKGKNISALSKYLLWVLRVFLLFATCYVNLYMWWTCFISLKFMHYGKDQIMTDVSGPHWRSRFTIKLSIPHAPITPLTSNPLKPCKRSTCRYCPRLNISGTFLCHSTATNYPSKINISCQSSNLIYLITCSKCSAYTVCWTN